MKSLTFKQKFLLALYLFLTVFLIADIAVIFFSAKNAIERERERVYAERLINIMSRWSDRYHQEVTNRRVDVIKSLRAEAKARVDVLSRFLSDGNLASLIASLSDPSKFLSVFIMDTDGVITHHFDADLIGGLLPVSSDMKGRTIPQIIRDAKLIPQHIWDSSGGTYYYIERCQNEFVGAQIKTDFIEQQSKQTAQQIIQEAAALLSSAFANPPMVVCDSHQIKNQPQNLSDVEIDQLMKNSVLFAPGQPPKINTLIQSELKLRQGATRAYALHFTPWDLFVGVTFSPVSMRELWGWLKVPAAVKAGVLIVILFAAYALISWLLRPLYDLATHSHQIASVFDGPEPDLANLKNVPALSMEYFRLTNTTDVIHTLAQSLLDLRYSLSFNVQRLIETRADRARMEKELELARSIQAGILPKIFPPFPHRSEIDIYAKLEPATAVGGDLYNFFWIDDEHLFFAVGDVAGHGVGAALYMVQSITHTKTLARQGWSPVDILYDLNDRMRHANPQKLFVTMGLGILDVTTGSVRYVSGGHPPPVLVPGGCSEPIILRVHTGTLIGTFPRENIEFQERIFTLAPGDALLLYTDGITEARQPSQGEFFSEDRLIKIVTSSPDVRECVHNIFVTVREFAGSNTAADDMAALMIRFNGGKNEK